jgi:hypothetical protein
MRIGTGLAFLLAAVTGSAAAARLAKLSLHGRSSTHTRAVAVREREWMPIHLPPVSTPAVAVGALALGALAVGALAIGALAVGRLDIRQARLRKVEIDDLTVGRLRVINAPKA